MVGVMRFVTCVAIAFCLFAERTQAAGFRFIDVPADASGPAIHGAIWYPCNQSPGEIALDRVILPGVKDCPIGDGKRPLVVISHGRIGDFTGHHDTAETLADAGFVFAAINHPGDTAADTSRSEDLSAFIERTTDIKGLIDFVLGAASAASSIDPDRIGLFGFSRGGYTGLVLIGANPDWTHVTEICRGSPLHACQQVLRKEFPAEPLTHDPRIKAAVIADPLAIAFTAGSFASVTVPIQLWASERGGDGVLPQDVAMVNESLPARHEYRVVPNSAHFAFLSPCAPALVQTRPEICADASGFDRAAFHREFNAAVL
jgi:predicted dienelactone hydrolase